MIFADTSFWYALYTPRDDRHERARHHALAVADRRWVTSNHVLGETWTLTNRRDGHRSAATFLDLVVRSSQLRIVHVREDLEQEALAWLRRRDEREYSFVDATSFALMRDLGIDEALSFDADFAAAGFRLPKE